MLRFNIEIFLTNFYYPRLFDETLLENSNFEGCLSRASTTFYRKVPEIIPTYRR